MLRLALLVSAVLLSLAGMPALAQHDHSHGEGAHVDADGTFKLGFDRNFRSGNARSVLTDIYGEFEGVAKLVVNPMLLLQTKLHWERVNFPADGPGQGPHGTTQRLGQNRLAYGGPGNTSAPQSFTLQYEFSDPAGLEGLTVGAGYRFLKAGSRQPATLQAASGAVASRDSNGYVAGARYEIGLPLDVVMTPFVEWARFTDVFNADPQIGVNQFKDRTYLTAAAIFTWRDFTLVGSRMTRTFARPDSEATAGAFFNQEDRQLAGNLLYKAMENLTLGIGYRRTRAVPAFGDVNRQAVTSSFGTQAVYTLEF